MYVENWNPFSTSLKCIHEFHSERKANTLKKHIFNLDCYTSKIFYVLMIFFWLHNSDRKYSWANFKKGRRKKKIFHFMSNFMHCPPFMSEYKSRNTICRKVFAFRHWNPCKRRQIECLKRRRAQMLFLGWLKTCANKLPSKQVHCWKQLRSFHQSQHVFNIWFCRLALHRRRV